jgi:cardiolipin synthase A/B
VKSKQAFIPTQPPLFREGMFIKKCKHFWTSRIFVTAMIILFQLALLLFIIWFLSEFFVYFYGFCIVLSIAVTIYIINKPGNPSIKLAWIIPILLFPVFGGLLYLAFGKSKVQEPLKSRIRDAVVESRRILVQDENALAQLKQTDALAFRQSRYIQSHSLFPLYRQTSARYLTPGEEKFKALLQKLKEARHFIFLEYFIIHEGKMWNAVLEILQQKVKEGVEVRVMYDDVGCINTLPDKYYETLRKMGIKAQVFNPLQPALDVRLQNRDHRKIAVIDGVVGFTGGINLADEYINEIVRFGHWKDASIMIEGMGVWNLTVMFLQMWNYSQDKTEDFTPYHPARYLKKPPADDGFVQPFGDSPLDHETVGENVYMQIINCAKEYVYITTPYLVVDNEMITALTLAAKSGVDVRIITPHI